MSTGDFNCPRCGERLPEGFTRCDACGAHVVPPEPSREPRLEPSAHAAGTRKKHAAPEASRMTGTGWMLLAVGLLCGGAIGYTLRGAVGPREEGGMPSGPADVMSGMSEGGGGGMGGNGMSGNAAGAAGGGMPTGMPEQIRQMVAEYRDRLAKNPKDKEALIGLGNLQFDSHQWDKAVESYQKALDQDPQNGDVRVDMAIAYHQLEQNDQAIQELERVTKETPEHRNAWLNLGVVSAAKGDNARAIRAWEQYLKLEPSSPHAAAIRAQIEDLKRRS